MEIIKLHSKIHQSQEVFASDIQVKMTGKQMTRKVIILPNQHPFVS